MWSTVRVKGDEVQLQIVGTKLCLSHYGGNTAHLWDCSSPHTILIYNTASKELRAGTGGQCLSTPAAGAVTLAACSGQQWELPAQQGPLSCPKVANVVATVCGSPSPTSIGIGWFSTPTPDEDFRHKGINGTVLMNTHKDGIALRVSLKRLPGDPSFRVTPTADSCSAVWANAPLHPSSESGLDIGNQNGFAASMIWLPLTRAPMAFVLRAGDRTVACATLVAIPHTQLVEDNSEADLFSMAARLHQQRSAQSAADEGTFIRMKEDAIRWLPGMDAVIARAKTMKIVLSAVCKNCAGAFEAMRASLEATGRRFLDYRIIMYENNSGDNTATQHRSWATSNPKVRAVSESVPDFCHREACIARARNQALNLYYNDAEYQDYPFFMFVDCDFFSGFKSDAVLSSFLRDDWDIACSNGVAGVAPNFYYWDRYAFRDERWPILQWKWFYDMRLVMLYDPGDEWVQCHACFGGFAVYRRSALVTPAGACLYNATDPINVVDVEHVSMSTCVRQHGGRVFINPAGFIRYPVMAYTP